MNLRGLGTSLVMVIIAALIGYAGWQGQNPSLQAVPMAAGEPTSIPNTVAQPVLPPRLHTTQETRGPRLVPQDRSTQREGMGPRPVQRPQTRTSLRATTAPRPIASRDPGTDTTRLDRVTEASNALLTKPLVGGRSTSRFGLRKHPVLHRWKLHTGHDWAAPCGTPVGAAAPGVVTRVGYAGGNGNQVRIDHGRLGGHHLVTTYNHLSAFGVSVGQRVNTGDGVGLVGSTGYSTGCHLHFEVLANGQFTDPLPWLTGDASAITLTEVVVRDLTDHLSETTTPTPDPSESPSPTPAASTTPGEPASSPEETQDPTGSPTPTTSPAPPETPSNPPPSGTESPSPGASSEVPAPTESGDSPTPEPTGDDSTPTQTPPTETPDPTIEQPGPSEGVTPPTTGPSTSEPGSTAPAPPPSPDPDPPGEPGTSAAHPSTADVG